MKATTSMPPKAERYTCSRCAMVAVAPIIVKVGTSYRCTNDTACRKRQAKNARTRRDA